MKYALTHEPLADEYVLPLRVAARIFDAMSKGELPAVSGKLHLVAQPDGSFTLAVEHE